MMWLPVAEDPRYYVSDEGDVESRVRRPRVLSPVASGSGNELRLKVKIGTRWKKVHLLVLETFVGPRPEGLVSRHLNGEGTDNRRANLCWGTPHENAMDTVRHGRNPSGPHPTCRRGHPYDEANMYVYTKPNGTMARRCRTCDRERKSDASLSTGSGG